MKLFSMEKDKYTSMALCLLMSLVSLATSLNGIAAGILGTKFLIGTVIVYGAYFFFLIMSLVVNKFAIKNIVLRCGATRISINIFMEQWIKAGTKDRFLYFLCTRSPDLYLPHT